MPTFPESPDPDFVPEDAAETPYTLPPDLLAPLSTPNSIFGQPVGAAGPPTGSPQSPTTVDPKVKMFANLLALLLAGGGGAGLIQSLSGGGAQTTAAPKLTPQALQAFGGAQQQFGQSGNLLQTLMGALQNPQIPPGLSLLTEQAFQPQLGNLYSQAVEAGRRRGFHDAPGTSPPGGAILGPGLADIQGQMAQAKLNLYQNSIANLLHAFQGSQALAQGQGQLAAGLPSGQVVKAPKPTILDLYGKVSPIVKDIGSILGAVNPPPPSQIPQQLTSLLSGLFS